jgi:dienelactone hydrolase
MLCSRTLLSLSLATLISAAAPAATIAQTKGPAPQTVDVKAADGVMLKASYYSAGKPGPGIMLFHACNRDRSSWTHLATEAAARGFHVLALDFRGFGNSGGERFQNSPEQQSTIEVEWPRDVDAAYTWLTSQPGVDKTRIAAAGASCGVNQSVQLARRHPEVKTVVLLSGNVNPGGRAFLRDSPGLPVLAAASHGDGGAVSGMKWLLGWSRNPANKFVEYKAAGHGTDMFAVEKGLEPLILKWFEGHLRSAPAATAATSGVVSKPTPVEEFWTSFTAPGNAARAREIYQEAKKKHPGMLLLPETETNLYGYQLLQDGNAKDALTVFQLNVDAYPASANTYDSLSDAYLALGNKVEALKYAQKAVDMLPKDAEASNDFKKLVREAAEKKIKELKQ